MLKLFKRGERVLTDFGFGTFQKTIKATDGLKYQIKLEEKTFLGRDVLEIMDFQIHKIGRFSISFFNNEISGCWDLDIKEGFLNVCTEYVFFSNWGFKTLILDFEEGRIILKNFTPKCRFAVLDSWINLEKGIGGINYFKDSEKAKKFFKYYPSTTSGRLLRLLLLDFDKERIIWERIFGAGTVSSDGSIFQSVFLDKEYKEVLKE